MTRTPGRVMRTTGSWYTVLTEGGHFIECRLKGKFRLEDISATNPIAAGDRVLLEKDPENPDTTVITEILPRKNYIVRQSPKHKHARHILAANLDFALLVVTLKQPRTSTGFIDRFLVTAEAYHIPAIIVFNKQDIYDQKDLAKQEVIVNTYKMLGYETALVSCKNGTGTEQLREKLQGKTTLISGHSGSGKSTLINLIEPGFNLRTGDISYYHEKGKHTTTYAEMFPLSDGSYLIDTPGIKEFGVLDIELNELSHYFPEMRSLILSCRFNNCLHENEPGCKVYEQFESGAITAFRYQNYLNILEDLRLAQKVKYK